MGEGIQDVLPGGGGAVGVGESVAQRDGPLIGGGVGFDGLCQGQRRPLLGHDRQGVVDVERQQHRAR